MQNRNKKTRWTWRTAQVGVMFFACVCMVSVSISSMAPVVLAADDKEDLKDDEKDLVKDINKEEEKLQEAQSTLAQTQANLNQTTARVSQTEDEITRIKAEIAQREASLAELKKKLEFQRSVLGSAVRELYYIESGSGIEEVFSQTGSRFLSTDHDQMSSVRDRVMLEVEKVETMHQQIEAAKAQLAEQQAAQKELLDQQKREQQALAVARNAAAVDVQKRAASLAELKDELSKVRSKLASLLGDSLDADDIIDAAKIASKATGVRKDFLLGELVVETNLGTYTGGCTYKETRMRDNQKDALKQIAEELDINYKKVKLSCAPGYGYGGAMGVAQFMPLTWLGYKSQIAAATGHNPPDPWDLVDGVMAMALYLKNKGADKKSNEFDAAKRYYCGSPASAYWNTKCNDYAEKVLYWADNYERLID